MPIEELRLAGDFPTPRYRDLYARVLEYKNAGAPGHRDKEWQEFSAAWRAIAYRYLTCAEHDGEFTKLLRVYGDAPPEPYRYLQERELFGFFTSGAAVLDCLFYAMFAIGSLANPQAFEVSLLTPLDNVTPRLVSERFVGCYPGERLSELLAETADSSAFKEWREIRGVLVHRSLPGRTVSLSSKTDGPLPASTWKIRGHEISDELTGRRREWLRSTVTQTIVAAERFVRTHLR